MLRLPPTKIEIRQVEEWVYLDDIRTPPREDWVIARDFEEAIVESRGLPDFISFDHDLGEGLTGYDFASRACNAYQINDSCIRLIPLEQRIYKRILTITIAL